MTSHGKVEKLLPAAQAAEEMGTTPLGVLMHLKRRLLDGVEKEGEWLVTRESLDRLLARAGGAEKGLCRSACASASKCGGCA